MALPEGDKGFKTKIGVVDGGTTYFAKVRDVTGMDQTADDVDLTHNDLVTPHRVFIAGLIDSGEASTECIFDPEGYAFAKSIVGVYNSFVIEHPTLGSWDFEGYVKTVGAALPMGDAVSSNLSIKVSGDYTYNPPA